jgi:hypothetical protein
MAPVHVLGATWLHVHVLFLLSAMARGTAAWLAVRIEEPAARGVPDLMRAIGAMLARRSWRAAPSERYALLTGGTEAPRG